MLKTNFNKLTTPLLDVFEFVIDFFCTQLCSIRELFSGRFDDEEIAFLLQRFNGDQQDTINFILSSARIAYWLLLLYLQIFSILFVFLISLLLSIIIHCCAWKDQSNC